MWHLSFCLGLLVRRRREPAQGDTDFLGYEAFTRPTDRDGAAVSSFGADGPGDRSSVDEKVFKAA